MTWPRELMLHCIRVAEEIHEGTVYPLYEGFPSRFEEASVLVPQIHFRFLLIMRILPSVKFPFPGRDLIKAGWIKLELNAI